MLYKVSRSDFPILLALVLFAIAAIGTGIGTAERMKGALLRQDALETAHAWRGYIEKKFNFRSTETPKDAPLPPHISQKSGDSFRYRLFNIDGVLVYDSGDGQDTALAKRNPSSFQSSGWSDLLNGETLVRILRESVGEPAPTYADVFVPVVKNGKTRAVIEVNIDQTSKAERFDHVFRISALVTMALLMLGIGIPGGLLWYSATARRKVEQEIDYLSHHDSLTGLINRKSIDLHLTALLAQTNTQRRKVGVLSIGIDGFKSINDSLGHLVGDLLLSEISDRCRIHTREADVVGRISGDEFAVIAPGFRTADELVDFADELRALVTVPLEANGHFLSPSISIGIAMAPDDGLDAELLVKRATVAQNWAKNEKQGSVRVFDTDMDAAVNHRFKLEMDMKRALDLNQFSMVYQPQIDLRTGEFMGCEALVRWQHPELGEVSPDRFIPIAERNGFIHELGAWILRRACEDAAAWPKPISVGVNLSPAQFEDVAIDSLVSDVLRETGLDPARLELEITEGLILNDTEAALRALHKLRSLGVSIAMDDFGTGYSSLSYLTLFPYTKLKIDRSLLERIEDDPNVSSVIRSMVGLCRSLNMKIVCEGVESLAQTAALNEVDCEFVQGFLFARPMSCELLTAQLWADLEVSKQERQSSAA